MSLRQISTQLLQSLIQLNTVNPPGNEGPAIELIENILQSAGFETTVVAKQPDRPNLVATLGSGSPVLGLLSHVDTVLADASKWQYDPWSATIDQDQIWGRGAIDMKSQTAAEVAAAVTLAESGWKPQQGTLKIIVVSDEETGSEFGARYLCENHPELAYVDMLINEGGGSPFTVGDQRLYSVCVGEKGPLRFALEATGVAAHAATPDLGENALLKLLPLVNKLAAAGSLIGLNLVEPTRQLLRQLGQAVGCPSDDPAEQLAAFTATNPELAKAIAPMVTTSLSPNIIGASDKINVVPATAQLRVDCRIPPGLSRDEAEKQILEIIGDLPDGVELTWTEHTPGNYSPSEGPLWDAICEWLNQHDSTAVVAPTLLPGFTDSRTFRSTFPDCTAYGFFPHQRIDLATQAGLMHAKDERIYIDDLELATQAYSWIITRLLGGH